MRMHENTIYMNSQIDKIKAILQDAYRAFSRLKKNAFSAFLIFTFDYRQFNIYI